VEGQPGGCPSCVVVVVVVVEKMHAGSCRSEWCCSSSSLARLHGAATLGVSCGEVNYLPDGCVMLSVMSFRMVNTWCRRQVSAQ
jgi:hypothetical protein